MIYSNTTDTK